MNEGIAVEVKTPTTEIEIRNFFLAQGDNVVESGILAFLPSLASGLTLKLVSRICQVL